MSCLGSCCAVFTFPMNPRELRDRAEGDDLKLADMLIELTPEEAEARMAQFDVDSPMAGERVSLTHPMYACRHWDEDTRLCGIYDDRPQMCAGYPYAGPCQHNCKCEFVLPPEERTKHRPIDLTEGDYADWYVEKVEALDA